MAMTRSRARRRKFPPIADYGLIGGAHTVALVSRAGSIDWCCLPRLDSGSCFARLLDAGHGGHCLVAPSDRLPGHSAYEDDTLVLTTTFEREGGQARLIDFFPVRPRGRRPREPEVQIFRRIEGQRGSVDIELEVEPRFDYGSLAPWMRQESPGTYSAIGGDDGLVIWSDADLEQVDDHAVHGRLRLRAGQRVHLCLTSIAPERLDEEPPQPLDAEIVERRLQETLRWWRSWARQARHRGPDASHVRRSALTLKALSYAPTGAIAAAATTSLPEAPEGKRNWDYRYSWVRDSTFAVRALAELGYEDEAGAFRRFIIRSAAGHADQLQILYGIAGERRLPELEISHLSGYRDAAPVRIGNSAAGQRQSDVYGELLNLTWRWFERGHSPSDDDWRFLSALVEAAIECWKSPDRGIWEWRGRPLHFVHSKASCWAAVDRGLRLADASQRRVPVRRWRQARDQIRRAIERRGYDRRRGVFVAAFDRRDMDGALLMLPVTGFVAWDDERMVRTTDAVARELDEGGLLRRYRRPDGLPGREGAFVPCSFWLSECYARQGRVRAAREVFDRAVSTGNGLGLFAEEYDPRDEAMLGNFPQALTHLSHIAAAHALAEAESPDRTADAGAS